MVRRIGALVLTAALSAALSPSLGGAAVPGREEFRKARAYFEAEEYEAALRWFEKAYELSQRKPATILALAQCERALKRYEDAARHLREYLAVEPRPKDADAVAATLAMVDELAGEQKAERAELATGHEPGGPRTAATATLAPTGVGERTRTASVPTVAARPMDGLVAKPAVSSPAEKSVDSLRAGLPWTFWTAVGITAIAAGSGAYFGTNAVSAARDTDPAADPSRGALAANVAFAIAGAAALTAIGILVLGNSAGSAGGG